MNSIRNESISLSVTHLVDQANILKLSGSAPTHRMPRPTASSEADRAARTTRVGIIGSGGRSTDIQESWTYSKISHF